MLRTGFLTFLLIFAIALPAQATKPKKTWLEACGEWIIFQGVRLSNFILVDFTPSQGRHTREDILAGEGFSREEEGRVNNPKNVPEIPGTFFAWFHHRFPKISLREDSEPSRHLDSAAMALSMVNTVTAVQVMRRSWPEVQLRILLPTEDAPLNCHMIDTAGEVMRYQLIFWGSLEHDQASVKLLLDQVGYDLALPRVIINEFFFLAQRGPEKAEAPLGRLLGLVRFARQTHSHQSLLEFEQLVIETYTLLQKRFPL